MKASPKQVRPGEAGDGRRSKGVRTEHQRDKPKTAIKGTRTAESNNLMAQLSFTLIYFCSDSLLLCPLVLLLAVWRRRGGWFKAQRAFKKISQESL